MTIEQPEPVRMVQIDVPVSYYDDICAMKVRWVPYKEALSEGTWIAITPPGGYPTFGKVTDCRYTLGFWVVSFDRYILVKAR